jgi:hypothetical protein
MRSFKLPLKLCPTSAGYLSEGGRSGSQTATGRFWKCLLGASGLAKSLAVGASDILVKMVVWGVG